MTAQRSPSAAASAFASVVLPEPVPPTIATVQARGWAAALMAARRIAGGCMQARPLPAAARRVPLAAVRRAPWSFLWLAIAIRALVAVRTEVPGRDGVSYLWMAEAFARGDV